MKIINDPIHGFISIDSPLILNLIEHPYFQRLRRINQLGLTHLIYPGAEHTRFQHALGAYHLMTMAIEVLRKKGHEITTDESEAAEIAILLHDIGHGPFSHVLEKIIIPDIKHEHISLLMIKKLNECFEGKLTKAIEIYTGRYSKKFLCQLISGQLDVDRLDYLGRDSFFCGVSEGSIGTERIIKMMNIKNNQLVIDYKGMYSVEKFLIARRFMYWQVYLHKTAIAAEQFLINIFRRAKKLINRNCKLPMSKYVAYFFHTDNPLRNKQNFLKNFVLLDDSDIFSLTKNWITYNDKILSFLSKRFLERKFYRTELSDNRFDIKRINKLETDVKKAFELNDNTLDYFFSHGRISTQSYTAEGHQINILFKDGSLKNISDISALLNMQKLLNTDTKFYLCYPKEINTK